MILPDHEIKSRLAKGDLVIKPLEDPELQIQPANVDLRLGSKFRIFKITSTPYIDTRDGNKKNYTEEVTVKDGDPFIVHPGEFLLAFFFASIMFAWTN